MSEDRETTVPDNKNKTAILLASRPTTVGMRRYLPPNPFVVSADAGWKNAQILGLQVDLAVGDFDSSSPPQQAKEVILLPQEKDDTDTMFAAREIVARGFGEAILFGATGGRTDHFFANLQTMLYLAKQGVQSKMYDDKTEIFCLWPGEYRFASQKNRFLSVFAAGGAATRICLEQVKYPLWEATLTPDTPLGISNEFLAGEDEAVVRFREGYLYVMVCEE